MKKPDTSILLCTSEDDEIPLERWEACVAAAKANRPALWAGFWEGLARRLEDQEATAAAAESEAA